jgi:hypothetical protein
MVAGTALMASNTVAPSHAGTVHRDVQISTTLSAETASIGEPAGDNTYEFHDLTATLTDGGHALAGQVVKFSADGVLLCTDTTGPGGVASCANPTSTPTAQFSGKPTSYTATFTGSGPLQPSDSTKPLTPGS